MDRRKLGFFILFGSIVVSLPGVADAKSRTRHHHHRIAHAGAQTHSGHSGMASVYGTQTLKEYNQRLASAENQVREMLSKATADAERAATAVRARAQQEAEESKERALRDIDAARKQAVGEIYAEAANLATGVAEKILRRNLNADDQRDLVNRSLEELGAMK